MASDFPTRTEALTAPSLRIVYDLLLRIEAAIEGGDAARVQLIAALDELRAYLDHHATQGS